MASIDQLVLHLIPPHRSDLDPLPTSPASILIRHSQSTSSKALSHLPLMRFLLQLVSGLMHTAYRIDKGKKIDRVADAVQRSYPSVSSAFR